MKSKQFVYTGCENLEAMKEAKNYNQSLIDLVVIAGSNLKNKRILDFGAGSGTYADMLKGFQNETVECLEPDKKLVSVLKKNGYTVYTDLSKIDNNKYDLIYSLNVFEHIENDLDNFHGLVKKLKKNGSILIYVPAFQLLYSSMDKKVEHVRRYRKKRLLQMALDNQLEVIDLDYKDPLGFFVTLIFKLIGNKTGTISPKSVKIYDTFIYPINKLIEPFTKRFFGKNVYMIAKKNGKSK